MTYYESATDTLITAKRAQQEVEKHGASWAEFVEEHHPSGDLADSYDAQAVLRWLGY